MKFFFRVDSTLSTGSGHLMRCFFLSEELASLGVESYFILNRDNYFNYSFLDVPNKIFIDAKDPEDDSAQTIDVLNQYHAEKILMLDSYQLGSDWESKISSHVKRLIVWDDLANREHYCDLLIDCGLLRRKDDYIHLMQKPTRFLIGPNYCPISKEFQYFAYTSKESHRLHIFFGSGDDGKMALTYFEALSKKIPEFKFNVAVSRELNSKDKVTWDQVKRDGDSLFVAEPMSHSLNGCSFALGSPGITTWERIYLKIYSFYITTHHNQVPIVQELANHGICSWLGPSEETPKFLVDRFVNELRQSVELKKQFSELVDGKGLKRIAEEALK